MNSAWLPRSRLYVIQKLTLFRGQDGTYYMVEPGFDPGGLRPRLCVKPAWPAPLQGQSLAVFITSLNDHGYHIRGSLGSTQERHARVTGACRNSQPRLPAQPEQDTEDTISAVTVTSPSAAPNRCEGLGGRDKPGPQGTLNSSAVFEPWYE